MITFLQRRASSNKLVASFWQIHNPTTRNRQGFDVGDQYRSAIFVHGSNQALAATDSRAQAQTRTRRAIVTEIIPAGAFYNAEEYDQRYFEKHG